MGDRGEPEASCSEWHGDGTAGESDRALHLAAVAPARVMGEARPARHLSRWQDCGAGAAGGGWSSSSCDVQAPTAARSGRIG